MKNGKVLLMLVVLLFSLECGAKNLFQLNSNRGPMKIWLNGESFDIDSSFVSLETVYPLLDTLILKNDVQEQIEVLCNFKPDSIYTLIMSCCGSTDVVSSSRLNFKTESTGDPDLDFDKHLEALKDTFQISFRLERSEKSGSIYAWYNDWACFPKIVLMSNSTYEYGNPQKCYFYNNISTFEFFKDQFGDNVIPDEMGFIEDVYPDEEREVLGQVHLRVFDKESFVVVYNSETQKVSVKKYTDE